MSLAGDVAELLMAEGKPRMTLRACDVCRRRKIKCESALEDGSKCNHCATFNLPCTYDIPVKRRGPARGYVLELEARVKKMEAVLRRLGQGGSSVPAPGTDSPKHGSSPRISGADTPVLLLPPIAPSPLTDEVDSSSSEDEEFDPETQGVPLWIRKFDPDGGPGGYQGKSSAVHLLRSAFKFREEYRGERMFDFDLDFSLRQRRPDAWKLPPWEVTRRPGNFRLPEGQAFNFPEPDLLNLLIGNFFRQTNPFLSLLNQVLFRKQVSQGLHLVDDGFGGVVLLVAALGSRDSSDPRVYYDPSSTHSGGWKWFNQVHQLCHPLVAPATLYDIQIILLSITFLHGSSAPDAGWSLLGTAIQLAINVGAHRRKAYGPKPTVRGELWKRAFWVLICMDRLISSSMGRSLCIRDEDFDLDLPIDCDDEYWFVDDPERSFKQPEGKPSCMSGFIHLIKYFQIVSFVMRTIYTTNRSKSLLGFVGPQWEERVVAQCDSALNQWKDAIPEHLRWDPPPENYHFFHQSSALIVFYYQLQITIHRPFIPRPRKQSSIPFPSLAICTNAARSMASIFEIIHDRLEGPIGWHITSAFVAGVTLLVYVFQRDRRRTYPADEMKGIHNCLRILELCEKAWHISGQYRDILYDLASVCELPLPERCASTLQERHTQDTLPRPAPSSSSSLAGALGDQSSIYSNLVHPSLSALPTNEMDGYTSIVPQAALDPWHDILVSGRARHSSVNGVLVADHDPLSSAAEWNLYAAPPGPTAPSLAQSMLYASTWDVAGSPASDGGLTNPSSYDTPPVWSTAPISFESNDWNSYLGGFSHTNPVSNGTPNQAFL